MTTLLILGAIGCMAFAAVIAALVVVAAVRRALRPEEKTYPQDAYYVWLPTGQSQEIVGYLRMLPNGVLTFVNEAGKVTFTFGIGGWWRVMKTSLPSELAGA